MTVLTNQGKRNLLVTLEPWGEEYPLAPGHKLRLTSTGGDSAELEILYGEDRVTVYGSSGASIKVEQLSGTL